MPELEDDFCAIMPFGYLNIHWAVNFIFVELGIEFFFIATMDDIPTVQIDAHGVFKYILIELKDENENVKLLLRGFEFAKFHGKSFLSMTEILLS